MCAARVRNSPAVRMPELKLAPERVVAGRRRVDRRAPAVAWHGHLRRARALCAAAVGRGESDLVDAPVAARVTLGAQANEVARRAESVARAAHGLVLRDARDLGAHRVAVGVGGAGEPYHSELPV